MGRRRGEEVRRRGVGRVTVKVGEWGWGRRDGVCVCVGVCGCVWVCVGMCGCVWYWTIPQVNSPRLHMAQAVLMIFSVLAR